MWIVTEKFKLGIKLEEFLNGGILPPKDDEIMYL